MQAGCRRWRCPACGRRKARKVAARFSRLGADVLMTLSLPRSVWATRDNAAELQKRCRWLLRYTVRHKLVSAYGWVREQGAPRAECVCAPTLQGCACGANGRQLHRHYLLRVPRRDRFRRGWLPYAKLQAAAKRCGLGTLDFRVVFSGAGAGAYVSKYLSKSVGDADGSARRYALSVSIPEIKEAGWSWSPARVRSSRLSTWRGRSRLGCDLLGNRRLAMKRRLAAIAPPPTKESGHGSIDSTITGQDNSGIGAVDTSIDCAADLMYTGFTMNNTTNITEVLDAKIKELEREAQELQRSIQRSMP